MLSDFQQALAEITALPERCLALRDDPSQLERYYTLSERERRQLLAVLHHPAMECTCSLYRADRLAPLLRNLPRCLQALGERLEGEVTAYWRAHPWPYRYSFLESERFLQWLGQRQSEEPMHPALAVALREEGLQIRERMHGFLEASGLAIPSLEP
jgi:hypothetical protein